jgi:hypothetical protein
MIAQFSFLQEVQDKFNVGNRSYQKYQDSKSTDHDFTSRLDKRHAERSKTDG